MLAVTETPKVTDNQWQALDALYDLVTHRRLYRGGLETIPASTSRWFQSGSVAFQSKRKITSKATGRQIEDTPWARTCLEALVRKGLVSKRLSDPSSFHLSAHPEYALTEAGIAYVKERRGVKAAAPEIARELTGGAKMNTGPMGGNWNPATGDLGDPVGPDD